MARILTLLASLLIAVLATAAQSWPDPVRILPAPSDHAYGLAWDGQSLWSCDYDAARLFEINSETGAIRRSLPAPCPKPTGLAWDGRRLWIASESTGKLYQIEPRRGRVLRELPSPVKQPSALAWSPEGLWIAGKTSGTLHLIDTKKGKRLRTLNTEAVRPRGLVWDGEHLWVHCALNQAFYCMDTRTGRQRCIVYSPSAMARGLAWNDAGLWVACRGRGGILQVPFVDGDGYTLSDPLSRTVTLVHRIENECGNLMRKARITIAVPPETERQRVHELVWSGSPARWTTDAWGARYAVFEATNLAYGDAFEASWTAQVDVATVRWCFDQKSLGDWDDARAALASDYSCDTVNYCLGTPAMQAHGRAAIGDTTDGLGRIAAIRQYLFNRVEYVLDGGWQDAPTVLERGTGSCSEYTYCFNALLRLNGYATRNIGSSVYPSRSDGGVWVDKVFHRWLEVYVPGYGWVPFDANSDDTPSDQPRRLRRWGAVINRLFITHITPRGGEDTPLGWAYGSLGEMDWENLFGPQRAQNQRRIYWSE